MTQSRIALQALAARQGEDTRTGWSRGFLTLTPALSLGALGERVNHTLRGEQSRHLDFPLRGARCSLSLRERVRVRGNGANDPLGRRTSPGTVELDESSGEAGVFPEWQ